MILCLYFVWMVYFSIIMVVYFSIIISKSWVVLLSFCIYSGIINPIFLEKTSLSESCTRFRDVVQIVRNTNR